MFRKGDYLRYLYRGGRPNAWARLQNRLTTWLATKRVGPSRLVALEVVGRRTGRAISFPLVAVDQGGETYLVAMLGEATRWVANVRADSLRAVLVRGTRQPVRLVEVPVPERGTILRRYLDLAPGARPHVRVDRRATPAEFDKVAADYPVFRVVQAAEPTAP